ncbi:titin homolog [Ptychodera flava]|uniref:titin homolog n=1 Tax=Ptychodera flava TaxID=63121 RepID=UPI00396A9B87
MALHMYERVVNLISKEPDERKVSDIESLLQWFLNKSNLLKSLQKDVVVDIIKNCEFRKTPEDTVIIRQGERGDSFFINLSGSVSVYINAQLEDLGVARKKTAKSRKKSEEKSRRISEELRARKRSEVAEKQRRISQEKNRRTSKESGGAASRKTSAEVKQPDRVKDGVDSRAQPDRRESSERPERSKTPVKKAVDSTSSSSSDEDDDEDDDDEEDEVEAPADLKSNLPKEKKRDDKKLDRTPYGQHIVQLGSGKSFGEIALIQKNCIRTASIIADTDCDLIVINRDLYTRCLKAAQEAEFRAKHAFINNFPLFKKWNPKFRNLIAMSLRKIQVKYNHPIVRQGEKLRAIVFIAKGQAKVSIEPALSKQQYPDFFPQKDSVYAEFRKDKTDLTLKNSKVNDIRKSGPDIARRREGYVAAERQRNKKCVDICVVGTNEMIGDVEAVLKLGTYMQTVTSMEATDIFELNLNNFERLIIKKNPTTLDNMKMSIETKLKSRLGRLNSVKEGQVPLLETLVEKFEDMNTPPSRKQMKKKNEGEKMPLLMDTAYLSSLTERKKQRDFLRRRQRERRIKAQQLIKALTAHASSNMNTSLHTLDHKVLEEALQTGALDATATLRTGTITLNPMAAKEANFNPNVLTNNQTTASSILPTQQTIVRPPKTPADYTPKPWLKRSNSPLRSQTALSYTSTHVTSATDSAYGESRTDDEEDVDNVIEVNESEISTLEDKIRQWCISANGTSTSTRARGYFPKLRRLSELERDHLLRSKLPLRYRARTQAQKIFGKREFLHRHNVPVPASTDYNGFAEVE